MSELTCQELTELVTDYFDEALIPSDRIRFDEHLAECEGCVAYLMQFTKTIELTGSLSESDIPALARDALLAQFRDWKRDSEAGAS